ncbi:MAG: TMEM43 family protein [Mailhella sp.]|nr:TMEM43 family protein [Mailhella sp.]
MILLIPVLIALVYYHWNTEVGHRLESQAVQTVFRTQEITSPDRIAPELDGKFVHLAGKLESSARLRDTVTGMEENAVMLQRSVSYFQWSEIRHSHTRKVYNPSTRKEENETYYTYSYEKRWRDRLISTADFNESSARKKYRNGQIAVCRPSCLFAKDMHIGAYRIPEFLAADIKKHAEPLAVRVDDSLRGRLEASLRTSLDARGDADASSALRLKAGKLVHVDGNVLYYGADPANPEIGDMRITYSIVRPGGEYSLVAAAAGDTFEGIKSPKGKELARMERGAVSSDAMMGDVASSMSWGIGLERTLIIAAYMLYLLIVGVLFSDQLHTNELFPLVFGVLGGHSLLFLIMGLTCVIYEQTPSDGLIMLAVSAALALATVFIGIRTAPKSR